MSYTTRAMSTTEEQRFGEELETLHNLLFNSYFEEKQPAEEIQPVVNVQDSQMGGAEEINFSVIEHEINKIYSQAKAKGSEEREKS